MRVHYVAGPQCHLWWLALNSFSLNRFIGLWDCSYIDAYLLQSDIFCIILRGTLVCCGAQVEKNTELCSFCICLYAHKHYFICSSRSIAFQHNMLIDHLPMSLYLHYLKTLPSIGNVGITVLLIWILLWESLNFVHLFSLHDHIFTYACHWLLLLWYCLNL